MIHQDWYVRVSSFGLVRLVWFVLAGLFEVASFV